MRRSREKLEAIAPSMEAIAIRLEAIASRLEGKMSPSLQLAKFTAVPIPALFVFVLDQ